MLIITEPCDSALGLGCCLTFSHDWSSPKFEATHDSTTRYAYLQLRTSSSISTPVSPLPQSIWRAWTYCWLIKLANNPRKRSRMARSCLNCSTQMNLTMSQEHVPQIQLSQMCENWEDTQERFLTRHGSDYEDESQLFAILEIQGAVSKANGDRNKLGLYSSSEGFEDKYLGVGTLPALGRHCWQRAWATSCGMPQTGPGQPEEH